MPRIAFALVAVVLSGCGLSGSGTRCGIVSLAGPTLLLEEFTKPGRTLTAIPDDMPAVLPVRLAAGEATRGLVGKTDTSWVIGIDGTLPPRPVPGFGVLPSDPQAGPRGVLLYEGKPIPGAPVLGSVHLAATEVPLIGISTSVAAFEDNRCPLFPDSLRR